MKSPRVRYIIPSFNQGKFIAQSIDSILAQDYPNLEVVVIDGASTDNTLDVLRSYTDPRFRYVSAKDAGQTDAILKGIAFSGEPFAYFNWLGSDDLLTTPAAVSTLVEACERTGAVVAYGEGEYIDAAGRPTGLYNVAPADRTTFMQWCPVCQPSALIRYEAYAGTAGLDPKIRSIMDYDLWLKLIDAGGRFELVPGVLSQYRIHPDSKTASWRVVTHREVFQLFSERRMKITRDFFDRAFDECLVSPRLGQPMASSGGLARCLRLSRAALWRAMNIRAVQKALPLFFRQPRHDVLAYTRSYRNF
jgi:glycosyltransferase involved in cell wall biosynthesis